MNWRQRKKVFLAALEIAELAGYATACGASRKLNELAQFVEGGGKLSPGVLFTQAQRKSGGSWQDWAVDFLGCLPKQKRAALMIVKAYTVGEDQDRERESRGSKWVFWRKVKEKGLDKTGLAIVAKMDE